MLLFLLPILIIFIIIFHFLYGFLAFTFTHYYLFSNLFLPCFYIFMICIISQISVDTWIVKQSFLCAIILIIHAIGLVIIIKLVVKTIWAVVGIIQGL